VSGTITEAAARAEAELLDEAERSRTQVRQTSDAYPNLDIDGAYLVQAAWRDLRLERGEQLVGHKIGLTSRAMQIAMNITTPDSGFLTDAMVFAADSTVSASDFCDPKLEVELAFVLGGDLTGAETDVDDVLAATDHVIPAVEIIAARSYRRDPATGRTRTVIDTIADNAADAGIVTGPKSVRPNEVDLRWIGALAYRNGIVEETGLAAGVLDHPARGIAWLARRYAEHNMALEAGQTILAGSFTRPIDIRAGDRFRFDYGPLGSFGLDFV
jgi:2-oxo-hept-3-ene-1,7-dioate hydratase